MQNVRVNLRPVKHIYLERGFYIVEIRFFRFYLQRNFQKAHGLFIRETSYTQNLNKNSTFRFFPFGLIYFSKEVFEFEILCTAFLQKAPR